MDIIPGHITRLRGKIQVLLQSHQSEYTKPLIQPKNDPKAKTRIIEIEIGIPILSIHQPPNIAAETPNAPKDKFNPPVKITTIIARPIIISNATTLDNA